MQWLFVILVDTILRANQNAWFFQGKFIKKSLSQAFQIY